MLVRLSCLARVQEEKDYLQLRAAWDALKARERSALTDHFLADGIEASCLCKEASSCDRLQPLLVRSGSMCVWDAQEQAFILEFLPNCVANSKAPGKR